MGAGKQRLHVFLAMAAIVAAIAVACTNDFDQFAPERDDDGGDGSSSLSGGGSDCGEGYARCSGICINVSDDEGHCGSCTRSCPFGVSCEDGNCACPGALTLCPAGCIDTSSDEDHCGGCNIPCAPSENCVSGHCQ